MPRVTRSPTAAQAKETQRVMSSPDISNIERESESTNITSRSKRFRPDYSPEHQGDFKAFETKIMRLLTSWKEDQDTLLHKLTDDINEVKLQNKEIQRTNNEIEKSIEYINLAYEDMKKTVERLEKERLEQRAYIMDLERKVLDLQQSTRSASLELRNIPWKENETTSDLTTTMLNVCNTLKVPLKPSDLRDIHRIPGKKGTNRPIVAELLTVPLKTNILDASRNFNKGKAPMEKLNTSHIGITGEAKPIYVAEHLPTSQRQLFFEARKFASSHNYKFCWAYNNKIFLRKQEVQLRKYRRLRQAEILEAL